MPFTSDRIREIAAQKYVAPAFKRGDSRMVIGVKELQKDLYREGFPSGRIPMVCSALRGKKFLQENHLELDRVEGPPSGQSTTMIYHYRLLKGGISASSGNHSEKVGDIQDHLLELRGILRGSIREGAVAFVKELRRDKKKDSAAA